MKANLVVVHFGFNKGDISLQIVESSQVNIDVAEQASIMAAASHFNP
jgi:hypothetical protein